MFTNAKHIFGNENLYGGRTNYDVSTPTPQEQLHIVNSFYGVPKAIIGPRTLHMRCFLEAFRVFRHVQDLATSFRTE